MRVGLNIGITSARAGMWPGMAGGTDTPPSWLPTAPSGDRPVIYADFVNERYWGNGNILTAAQLFVEDAANWGTWSETAIVPGQGLDFSNANSNPVVNPAYVGPVVPLCSVVFSATIGDTTSTDSFAVEVDVVNLPSFAGDAWAAIFYDPNSAGTRVQAGFGALNNWNGDAPAVPISSPMGVAFTVYSNYTIGSACGAPNFTTPNPGPPIGQPQHLAIEGHGPRVCHMTTFSAYVPQPDVDLPTLSTF